VSLSTPADRLPVVQVAERLKDDYGYFVAACKPYVDPDNKQPLSPTYLDSLRWAAQSPQRERFLYAHRQYGKTTWITSLYPCWQWLRNPHVKGRVLSKSAKYAKDCFDRIKGALDQVPFLRHLRPPPGSWHADNRLSMHVAGARRSDVPSITVHGQMGQATGGRAHFLIGDDLVTPENSVTRQSRERTRESIVNLQRLVYAPGDGEVGDFILLGTYQCDDCTYAALVKSGWACRVYPLLYPTPSERQLIGSHLAPIVASAIDANAALAGTFITARPGFNADFLAREQRGGIGSFLRQHMGICRPNADDSYPLALEDFIVHPCAGLTAPVQIAWGTRTANSVDTALPVEVDAFDQDCLRSPAFFSPEQRPYERTHCRIDPAFGGDDLLSYAIASTLCGMTYIRALKGFHVRAGTHGPRGLPLDAIAQRCAEDLLLYGCRSVTIERNNGGEALATLLRHAIDKARATSTENWNCAVNTDFSTGNKNNRILAALETPLKAHRVVIDPTVAIDKRLQFQITRLRGMDHLDHDDLIEVLAAVVSDLRYAQGVDPARAAQALASREADELVPVGKRHQPPPRLGDRFRTPKTQENP
jgi:hypothetical protein